MKLLITTLLILSFTALFSQGNFIAKYYPSSSNSVADGGLKVEYLNHINPVIYTIELGTVINSSRFSSPQNLFFDVGVDTSSMSYSDSIIYGDTVSNILISETAQSNLIVRSYGAFRASAIDAITLDTLAIIKSKGYENEIDFNYVEAYSSSILNENEGSFFINTTSYSTNNGIYDTIYNSLASGPSSYEFMFPIFDFNNEANTSLLPAFDVDSLWPEFYEFGSSLGYSISFVITDTIVNSGGGSFTVDVVTVSDSINCSGSAVANISNGVGPYSYSWDGATFQNDSTIDSLCLGMHDLRVVNGAGDTVSNLYEIFFNTNSPSFPIHMTTISPTVLCNGEAIATVTQSTGPYLYSWDVGVFQNDSTIDSLCSGHHYVRVINGLGDTVATTFYINAAGSNFSLSDVTITETPYIECYNTATVSVNSATGPFTYSWDGGSFTSDSINNTLCSRNHTVSVKNASGYTVVSSIFIHTKTFIDRSPTYLNCLGKAGIHFNSLDTTSFLFSWDNESYSSNSREDSLCLGTHTLNIIDGFGDTLIQHFEIDLFDFYLSTHSTLNGCDGTAHVFHSGAPSDTTLYSWDGSSFNHFESYKTNLCEGIHTLAMTGAVLEDDTLVFPFAIANAQNTYTGNSTYGNDSVSVFYDNCSIDYSLGIDSLNFTTFNYIDSFFVDFTVEVWQNGNSITLSDTILVPNFSLSELNLSFTIYCSQKSNSDVIKVTAVVTPTNASTPTTPSTFIKEKTVNTITIFPNPTNNVLNIETGENLRFKIKIYDSRGQLVLQSNEKQIDVSLLANGLYYLNYQSKNSFSTSKFIKK